MAAHIVMQRVRISAKFGVEENKDGDTVPREPRCNFPTFQGICTKRLLVNKESMKGRVPNIENHFWSPNFRVRGGAAISQ